MTQEQWEDLPLFSPTDLLRVLENSEAGDQYRVGIVDAPLLVTIVPNENPASPDNPLSVKIETVEFE